MKKTDFPRFELIAVAVGELIVALALCAVYIFIGAFSPQTLFGLALGITVTLANFLILAITTTRAVNRVLERRPSGELSEEEAAKFAAENRAELQNSVKLSYIIRTVTLAASLVLAFVFSGLFDVIATAVPLLAFKPVLTVAASIKRRRDK